MRRYPIEGDEAVNATASEPMRKPEPRPWLPSQHTAPPGTGLAKLCEMVCRLEPGQCIAITHHDFVLHEVDGYRHSGNGVYFDPGDKVMGNIIGSSYTHTKSTDHNPERMAITFCRVKDEPGRPRRRRTYYAPDDHVRRQEAEERRKAKEANRSE